MKYLSVDPLKARLLPIHTNIILGWKCLLGTNTLAYSKNKTDTRGQGKNYLSALVEVFMRQRQIDCQSHFKTFFSCW